MYSFLIVVVCFFFGGSQNVKIYIAIFWY